MNGSSFARHALDELRSADRLLALALDTLHYARCRELAGVLGVRSRGWQLDATAAEFDSLRVELGEAQQRYEHALLALRLPSGRGQVTLETWGRLAELAGGTYGLHALRKAKRNFEAVVGLRNEIRELFASVRAREPGLADVEPLDEWQVRDEAEVMRTLWLLDQPGIVSLVAHKILFLLVAVMIVAFVL